MNRRTEQLLEPLVAESRNDSERPRTEKMRRARRFSKTRGGARFNGKHRRRNKRWGW